MGSFGENDIDQNNVGAATRLLVPTPIRVPAGREWTEISMGTQHACAIDDVGALWCWGRNDLGQTGVAPSASEPMHLAFPGPVVSVVAGDGHACAVAETGEVYCMGGNSWRVLGRSTMEMPSGMPTRTDVFPTRQLRIVQGYENQCSFNAAGVAICWGRNFDGELGFGDTMYFGDLVAAPHLDGTPLLVLAQRASYAYMNGANRVWGVNDMSGSEGYGRLGLGELTNAVEPSPLCIPEY